MYSFILRRTLYAIPVVLGTTAILFVIFNMVGTDPAYQIAGKHATPEVLANIRHEYGLDQSYVAQYFHLLKQLVTLDFGRSYSTKQKIMDIIAEGAGASFSLTFVPFIVGTMVSIAVAMAVAVLRGTIFDRLTIALLAALQSISALVYIIAAQYFLSFKMGWFPISGYDSSLTGRWEYLVLPWMIYILLGLAADVRFYRTLILDELYQDYVRTARSKGLGQRTVLFVHVLKNAMIPIITQLVISVPFLILGALLFEGFFGIPGLGDLVVRAIANSDRPILIATSVLSSVAYVVFNLISDVLYAVVDPRVKYK